MADTPYQKFKAAERRWRYIDHYCNPGPIQYMDYGHDSVADTIECCYEQETQVSDLIKGLCNTIHNSTMFVEHTHLLVAALSALKAT